MNPYKPRFMFPSTSLDVGGELKWTSNEFKKKKRNQDVEANISFKIPKQRPENKL